MESNQAAAAAASSSPAAPSRQTISISLSKKKKSTGVKPTKSAKKVQLTAAEEEYSTIAQHAEVLSKKRAQEGNVLVIPCKQGRDTGKPLLAGRAAAAAAASSNEQTNHNDVSSQSKPGRDEDQDEEDEATRQLIESATNRDEHQVQKTALGLTIAAPQHNTLNTKTAADAKSSVTDDELFRRDLSIRADDVDPNSTAYANISIGEFGSALLRGMGWQGEGGDNNNNNNTKSKETEKIKARPHRLGLGATPILPPMLPTGKHGRARRPEELKREEERRKMEEERERKRLELERLDVQFTLQKNSIVKLLLSNGREDRAKVIQTAGVPGLNRILVQVENDGNEVAVNKSSVVLCTWEELEKDPYHHHTQNVSKLNNGENERGSSSSKRNGKSEDDQYSRKRKDGDRTITSDEKKRSEDDRDRKRRHNDKDYSDDDSRYKRKRKESKRKDYSDDDSHYERKRRRKESSREKHNRRSDNYSEERDNSRNKHRHRDREDRRKDRGNKKSSDQQEQHLNWLLPNIRIRLVSKRYPRQHLNKGIVQDVISSQNNNPKAVILMDNQEVLDNVPERYLETALPKTGGNVIVLEGVHRWKKGRLLERSSEKARGIIQLFEDLEVIEVSLDGVAEWCGQLDEDME